MNHPIVHPSAVAEEIAHAFEEEEKPVDLSGYAFEDWVTLALFWCMAICVFLQFFTRYVLNSSLAWTEEIAVYCLVGVVFLGAAMCVRISRHIQVDVVYRMVPPAVARPMSLLVDVIRIVFFAYAAQLMWRYSAVVSHESMVTVDLPKWPVFYTVFAAFVLMALRSVQIFVQNLRRGYSVLERPDAFDEAEA
ncbi:TRAP transporter small permease [Azospirillum oleiclasticum]|uniref:TRAP transporter small permease n=1 Tax=Azospirillum oleiclasticum TaxID=2735135 RepID=UPI001B3B77A3